jgi:hypothetical protein
MRLVGSLLAYPAFRLWRSHGLMPMPGPLTSVEWTYPVFEVLRAALDALNDRSLGDRVELRGRLPYVTISIE